MKILFASANYGERVVGGAQLSIKLVAERLVRRGHEVGILFVDPNGHAREVLPNGISLFRVPPNNIYWHLDPRPNAAKRMVWHMMDRFGGTLTDRFSSVLEEFRPDVVHSNVLSGLTVGIWTAADRLGIPIVHTVHDYYLTCVNSGMRGRSGNCSRSCGSCRTFSSLSRRAAKSVSGVIYVSNHMRLTHEAEHVFSSDAWVSEIIGSYERHPPFIDKARADGRLKIGFLGRVAPDKGLDRLLDELRRMPPDQYELFIGGAGAPAYENALRERAQGMPVRFAGRVEPAGFLDGLDALVVPSLWNEPAGRVAFEAGLSRVPVVVTKRGGLPQMVGYGTRGWIYDPDHGGDLVRVLQTIRTDPVTTAAKVAAWDNIAYQFKHDYVVDHTLQTYMHAMAVLKVRRTKGMLGDAPTGQQD